MDADAPRTSPAYACASRSCRRSAADRVPRVFRRRPSWGTEGTPDADGAACTLDEPYRTIVALMHGSGIEVSVVLSLKRRDVDLGQRQVQAHGTKTAARDRIVTVEPWVMPYLRRHARRLLPNAPLYPGLNRWTVSDKHREVCKALEIEDYQLRDSGHTYAVRAHQARCALRSGRTATRPR